MSCKSTGGPVQPQREGKGHDETKGKNKNPGKVQSKSQSQPTKQVKRTMSEVSEASNESMNLSTIQNQLETMQESMLKKEDIETLITNTITHIMEKMEKKIIEEVNMKVEERTRDLQDQIDSLKFDYDKVIEKLSKRNQNCQRRIDDLEEKLLETEELCRDANKRSNKNEQYSRKNNVKIHNIIEEENETEESLTTRMQKILKDQNVELQKEKIQAIHRIPTKPGKIRPVIIKVTNNSVKTEIMKKRKEMKDAGYKLSDDVTALNTGLINRLTLHSGIQSAWFFNGSVYGETKEKRRMKFDLYDNIDQIIQKHQNRISKRQEKNEEDTSLIAK